MKPTAEYIRSIRENLGLGRTEFANLLGMSSTGERTVRGWEEGEHSPTAAKWNAILELENVMQAHLENAPFRHNPETQNRFKFIDLFAGIGGIRLPFQKLGGECVFTSEWDKFAHIPFSPACPQVSRFPLSNTFSFPCKSYPGSLRFSSPYLHRVFPSFPSHPLFPQATNTS